MNTVYWRKKKKKSRNWSFKSNNKRTVGTRFDVKKMLAMIHMLS